jgi:hypothetical protein
MAFTVPLELFFGLTLPLSEIATTRLFGRLWRFPMRGCFRVPILPDRTPGEELTPVLSLLQIHHDVDRLAGLRLDLDALRVVTGGGKG